MKIASLALAVSIAAGMLVACGPNFLGDGDAGASSGDDAGAATGPDGSSGADCTGNLGNGVSLCTYISMCPSIGVDHDQYPDCGFRVRGEVLDLECVCNGSYLCPMGIPTSCTQAAQMLNSQSEATVCEQINDGRCTSLVSSSADSGTNPCDTECSGKCGGDPSCIQGCGC